tara:strand:- start:3341 stop:3865 length:525 start_codon:yes stop_codon:yes gene_type:complete
VENQQTGDKRSVNATRRRLLKASAAAPLLASLTPNAALAMSSAAQCSGGNFSNMKSASRGNSLQGDTAVRMEVPYFKKKGPSVQGLANDLYDINGVYYHNSGTAYATNRDELLGHGYKESTRHVLVLFDVSGGKPEIVGYWPQIPESSFNDMHATPMTGSCWTSLNPSNLLSYN